MNLSQQQISYILSLYAHKNFGKAAEACFVTQPTLSMQIKKAEETLGFQIFNRNRSPLELTVYGQKLLPILYDMQAEYEKIIRLSKLNKGQITEELKIGIIPTIAAYLVPVLFKNQQLFNPQTKWAIIEMKSEELLDQLQQKKIDLGIMAGPVNQESFYSEPLYNEEIKVYTTDLGNEQQIAVEDLKTKQPWLLNSGNCLRTQMVHFCQLKEEHQAAWNYEGGNLNMLINMVNNYGGYTLLPEFFANESQIEQKHVLRIVGKENLKAPARSVLALSSHKNSKHPDLKAIIQFIKKEFANHELKKFEILDWK